LPALLTPFPADRCRFRPSCSPVKTGRSGRWLDQQSRLAVCCSPVCPLTWAGLRLAAAMRRWGPEDAKLRLLRRFLGSNLLAADLEIPGERAESSCCRGATSGRQPVRALVLFVPGRQHWAVLEPGEALVGSSCLYTCLTASNSNGAAAEPQHDRHGTCGRHHSISCCLKRLSIQPVLSRAHLSPWWAAPGVACRPCSTDRGGLPPGWRQGPMAPASSRLVLLLQQHLDPLQPLVSCCGHQQSGS